MTGIDFDYSDQKALVTRLEARTDEYERRRQRGGLVVPRRVPGRGYEDERWQSSVLVVV